MRNSIYARHGRKFRNQELQQYFNKQPWYLPEYSPDKFPLNRLSQIEKDNARFISDYQDLHNRRKVPK